MRRFRSWLRNLAMAGCALACLAFSAPGAPAAFSFDGLCVRAKTLAAKPYARPSPLVPDWLLHFNYDQYHNIRFLPAQSWWGRDRLPFQLQFFPPGSIFDRTVRISEVDGNAARPIPFSPSLFDFGKNRVGALPDSLGFAGFRILYPLNKPGDELGAFQGASYFRMLCEKAVYGLSARGLAIDTALPGGEEFPDFKEFWVDRPAPGSKEIVIAALLDGPSAAGAYRFVFAPVADTVMRVQAVIYCRKNPKVLGIAPLSSMFWHGKNTNFETDDIRPEVHDSDGLMIRTGRDEWLWRPLTNPNATIHASFSDENPRGFGLSQRERSFECYQDLQANYQMRPSVWIEPVGSWGRGAVHLIEFHTPDETNDNVVAFWAPAQLPSPGTPLNFTYDLHWSLDQIHPRGGYVIATRQGRTRTHETDLERFIVDFAGGGLERLGAGATVEPVVTVGNHASLANAIAEKNPFNGSWRVAFALRPDGSKLPVELRCYLKKSTQALTETWSYLWQP